MRVEITATRYICMYPPNLLPLIAVDFLTLIIRLIQKKLSQKCKRIITLQGTETKMHGSYGGEDN
jgi:hypothetical protein